MEHETANLMGYWQNPVYNGKRKAFINVRNTERVNHVPKYLNKVSYGASFRPLCN